MGVQAMVAVQNVSTEVRKLVSASVVNSMIRSWKLARLATDAGKLGYPRINILHPEHGTGDDDESPEDYDAELVQGIVERMPGEIRSAFEAFHCGIIRNESIRDWGHKARWLTLGIDKKTYYVRVNAGWRLVQDMLSETLDSPLCSV